LHALQIAHRNAARWLAAIVGAVALLLATPAISHAEPSNPNNYSCIGNIGAGLPEAGSEEQEVQYKFLCNGPITGYQLQAQIPVTGLESSPLVTELLGKPVTDTFACSGEFPGYALNCVGSAKAADEYITGQFAIETKLCAEPRVDPLLTVTYAYLEKGAVVQAISGPFDLGRPERCRPDALSGGDRLNPKPTAKNKGGKGKGSHPKPTAKKTSAHKK